MSLKSQRQRGALSWITGCEQGRVKRRGPSPAEASLCEVLNYIYLLIGFHGREVGGYKLLFLSLFEVIGL